MTSSSAAPGGVEAVQAQFMPPASFERRRLPVKVVSHALRHYFRFALGLGDVEEALAAQGIVASYATVRYWTAEALNAFAPAPDRGYG